MAYEDADYTRDGKKTGEPHPQAQRNLQQWLSLQKSICIDPKISVVFDRMKNINGNYVIDEPICISFYWKHDGNNRAYVISFHQEGCNFDEEVAKFFNLR